MPDAHAERVGGERGTLRSFVAYHTYHDLAAVMRTLPEPLAASGAASFGFVADFVQKKARVNYGRNLSHVLGRQLSDKELHRWTRRAFRHYARYWLEGSRLPNTDPQLVCDRMSVESGYEHLVENMELGKGVIMALPHVGTWEWGGTWLALQGYPMTSVAEPVEPRRLYDWFVTQREAMRLTIVPLGPDVGTVLLRTLRAGKLVGLLCDRDVLGNGVEVEFFGERTKLPGGPATLALRTGAAILPTAVYSRPRKQHAAVIMPPLDIGRTKSLRDDVTRVTQEMAYALEHLIRRAPEQWYGFQPNWPSDADM